MNNGATVWNNTSDMPHDAAAAFSAAGGWDDDMDWVMFVPKQMDPPMFVNHIDCNVFVTSQGTFYASYHS